MRPCEREAPSDCGGASVVVLSDIVRLVQCVGDGGKNAHSLGGGATLRQRLPTMRTTAIRNVTVR
ncbi:hypothetical protein GCM10010216_31800 [Streptomyces flaveolus]|nr:hypothetical protein GCM10010216_31800 [Streptomyces flaveolus]